MHNLQNDAKRVGCVCINSVPRTLGGCGRACLWVAFKLHTPSPPSVQGRAKSSFLHTRALATDGFYYLSRPVTEPRKQALISRLMLPSHHLLFSMLVMLVSPSSAAHR